ncbi:Gfo/Idh/MocA family protein [Peribacillus kribbensis]|uniref:Gfo/Idh/MocA family protein n=1 Tax=Peribacillus kribbensis TaxID=356658 RepID=UPI00040BAE7E|nr:Gfo/Idh/MocA family oxidoreductase [Peribacillus kribbensis]
MEILRIGVIGCGSIARYRHLPEYAANKHAEITAVCDISAERAEAMAAHYNAKAYTDYNELLADESIDAVSVCTPNYLHAPISIAALNAGKHVLCEKPMATSDEEAEAMIQAARNNNRKLMIGHNQRFVPSHRKARELIETGAVGKVYSFRTAFGHPGPEAWSADGSNSWFFRKEEAFIGAMGDLGVHKSDLIRYLLGEEIVEVAAFVENSSKPNSTVDDNAACILKSESGIIGTMAASWSYGREDNSTIIYAEKAVIRLEDHPEYGMIVQYTNGEVVKYELGRIQSNDEGGQNSSHVISSFLHSILTDSEVPVSGEEGRKSLGVILAALESTNTKQIVSLHAKELI